MASPFEGEKNEKLRFEYCGDKLENKRLLNCNKNLFFQSYHKKIIREVHFLFIDGNALGVSLLWCNYNTGINAQLLSDAENIIQQQREKRNWAPQI